MQHVIRNKRIKTQTLHENVVFKVCSWCLKERPVHIQDILQSKLYLRWELDINVFYHRYADFDAQEEDMQMVDRSQICLFDEFQKTHVNWEEHGHGHLSELFTFGLFAQREDRGDIIIYSNFEFLLFVMLGNKNLTECIKAGAVYFTYHGGLFRDRWHFNCNHSIWLKKLPSFCYLNKKHLMTLDVQFRDL